MAKKLHSTVRKKVRGISPVWIVPLVALFIAVWLSVQAYLEKGKVIEIVFASANDIIAHQTTIKLKNVNVGKVVNIELSKDLSQVVVKAELDASVSHHITENTRFWVVTPRVSPSGISNLGTLINGVYIQMDPGEPGRGENFFRGLDEPPRVKSDATGMQYILQTKELGHILIGSPVYYREVPVGEVTGYDISEDYSYVDVNVFIKSPYDELIQEGTKFWNVSGFGVSISADGVKTNFASLTSLVSGGVAFENMNALQSSDKAQQGHRFFLYEDKDSVLEKRYEHRYFYLSKFSGSIKGLSVGAPVEFKGIPIGEVIDISLNTSDNMDESLYIYYAIEPERIKKDFAASRENADDLFESMAREGLRAEMKTANVITGAKLIELAYTNEVDGSINLLRDEQYTLIPSTEGTISEVTQQLAEIVDQVNQIPIAKIGKDLSSSIRNFDELLADLNQQKTGTQISALLKTAEKTLSEFSTLADDVNHLIAPESALKYEVESLLKSLKQSSDSMNNLLQQIEQHPNSLFFGKETDE